MSSAVADMEGAKGEGRIEMGSVLETPGGDYILMCSSHIIRTLCSEVQTYTLDSW